MDLLRTATGVDILASDLAGDTKCLVTAGFSRSVCRYHPALDLQCAAVDQRLASCPAAFTYIYIQPFFTAAVAAWRLSEATHRPVGTATITPAVSATPDLGTARSYQPAECEGCQAQVGL